MATVASIAARRQVALERIEKATGGVAAPPVPIRDPQLAEVYRLEAIADYLEADSGGRDETLAAVEEVAPEAASEVRVHLAASDLEDMTVEDVKARTADADAATLDAMAEAERQGKNRKTALEAIEARRAELEAEGERVPPDAGPVTEVPMEDVPEEDR